MQAIKRTWQRGIGGKVLVGSVGLLATCCLISTPIALFSPKQAPKPPTALPAQALVAQVTVLATDQPATPSPTAAPTTTTEPTVLPTAAPTAAPTAEPTATAADVPTSTPEPTRAPPTIVVAAGNDSINVRSGPGTNYAILGQLSGNTPADVTGKSADGTWWQILYGGQAGWVSAQLVEFSGDAMAVAVVSAPEAAPAEVPVVEPAPTAVVEQQPETPTDMPTEPPVAEPPTQTPAPVVAAPCDCNGPDLNCGSFPSQSAAQACYVHCGGPASDPFRLDGNNDGSACESYDY